MITQLIDKYKTHKQDIFTLLTTLIIYGVMLPLIIQEAKRPVPRVTQFLYIQDFPLTLVTLGFTVTLNTFVNFFRELLVVVKFVLYKKFGIVAEEQLPEIQTEKEISNVKPFGTITDAPKGVTTNTNMWEKN